MTGQHVDDLIVRGAATGEKIVRRHQDPGRAEAALERVVALESVLQRREHRLTGKRLDRFDARSVGLDREDAAGAHRYAVESQRARTADPVLAADVGTREPEAVADEV